MIICRVIPAVIIVKPRILKFQTGGDLRDNPIWPLFHAQRNSATCQGCAAGRGQSWDLMLDCRILWPCGDAWFPVLPRRAYAPAPSTGAALCLCAPSLSLHQAFPCDTAPSSWPLPAAHPSSERERGRAVASGLAFRELWALVYL